MQIIASTSKMNQNPEELIAPQDTFPHSSSSIEENIEWRFRDNIIWSMVFFEMYLHVGALYGLYGALTEAKWATIVFSIVLHQAILVGVTAGDHRLWSHRSYKAKVPFRIFLAILQAMAFQRSIFKWARDHRCHHKYVETDGDPHNSNRGFFFSHIGWLLCIKHPQVKKLGQRIDTSDLLRDPVVYYQREYFNEIFFVFGFLMPVLTPHFLWSESLWVSYWVPLHLTMALQHNATSAAHMWGYKPYSPRIAATENVTVSAVCCGEGHHNFHHTFPSDYSSSEWGWSLNLSTLVIDIAAKLGLTYDLKQASKRAVHSCKERTDRLNNSRRG